MYAYCIYIERERERERERGCVGVRLGAGMHCLAYESMWHSCGDLTTSSRTIISEKTLDWFLTISCQRGDIQCLF